MTKPIEIDLYCVCCETDTGHNRYVLQDIIICQRCDNLMSQKERNNLSYLHRMRLILTDQCHINNIIKNIEYR